MKTILSITIKFFLLVRFNDLDEPKLPPVIMGKYESLEECSDIAMQNISREESMLGIHYQCIGVAPVDITPPSISKHIL